MKRKFLENYRYIYVNLYFSLPTQKRPAMMKTGDEDNEVHCVVQVTVHIAVILLDSCAMGLLRWHRPPPESP